MTDRFCVTGVGGWRTRRAMISQHDSIRVRSSSLDNRMRALQLESNEKKGVQYESGDKISGRSEEIVESPVLTSFSKFPELPPELRLKIWQMALKVPQAMVAVKAHRYWRTVPIKNASIAGTLDNYNNIIPSAERNEFQPTGKKPRYSFYYLSKIQPHPALLYVNHESKYEAEKRFKPIECSIDFLKRLGMRTPAQRKPMIDIRSDRLWFPDLGISLNYDTVHRVLMHTSLMTNTSFRSIAIPWQFFKRVLRSISPYLNPDGFHDPSLARKFFTMVRAVGLEEIVVVFGPGTPFNYNASFSKQKDCPDTAFLREYLGVRTQVARIQGTSVEGMEMNFTIEIMEYKKLMILILEYESDQSHDKNLKTLIRDTKAWKIPVVRLRQLD